MLTILIPHGGRDMPRGTTVRLVSPKRASIPRAMFLRPSARFVPASYKAPLTAWQEHQRMYASSGLSQKKIRSLYYGGGDDYRCTYREKGDGRIVADCELDGVRRRRRRRRGCDASDSEDVDDSDCFTDDDDDCAAKIPKSTYAYETYNPKILTQQPKTILNPHHKANRNKISDNGKEQGWRCWETSKGEAIQPTFDRVFNRMHQGKGFMKYPEIRNKRYKKWSEDFYTHCKGDEDCIFANLQKIIARQHLNPSERGEGGGRRPAPYTECENDRVAYLGDEGTFECRELSWMDIFKVQNACGAQFAQEQMQYAKFIAAVKRAKDKFASLDTPAKKAQYARCHHLNRGLNEAGNAVGVQDENDYLV